MAIRWRRIRRGRRSIAWTPWPPTRRAAELASPGRLTLAVLTLLVPAGARAQTCYRARPAPACRVWFITEAYVGATTENGPAYAGGHLGVARNLGPRDAVGVGLTASSLGVALGPRYRRWLSPRVAFDAGPAVQWVPGRIERVQARAQVLYDDRVGLWTSAVVDFGSRPRLTWSGGVSAGAEAGVVSYGVGALATAVVVILYARNAD